MHAIQTEECAEADGLSVADAVIASVTEAVRQDMRDKRKTRRLTIPEQDKLRERIAVLESRLRYGWVVLIAVALVSAVLGKALAVWL